MFPHKRRLEAQERGLSQQPGISGRSHKRRRARHLLYRWRDAEPNCCVEGTHSLTHSAVLCRYLSRYCTYISLMFTPEWAIGQNTVVQDRTHGKQVDPCFTQPVHTSSDDTSDNIFSAFQPSTHTFLREEYSLHMQDISSLSWLPSSFYEYGTLESCATHRAGQGCAYNLQHNLSVNKIIKHVQPTCASYSAAISDYCLEGIQNRSISGAVLFSWLFPVYGMRPPSGAVIPGGGR